MLVNSRQKIAVLASGLAIATTGFVTDADASNKAREHGPAGGVRSEQPLTPPAGPPQRDR